MSPEILDEKKDELGTYDYHSQFQQDPTPPEGGMIKRRWFTVIDAETSFTHVPHVHFWIDTGYEEKKNVNKRTGTAKNDPTGLMATYFRNGKVYILDYRSVYMEIHDLVKFINDWALEYGYRASRSMIHIEPKASGKSTVQMLRQFTDLNVKEIEGRKDSKETELRNMSPRIEAGRVVLVQGSWNRKYLDEICGFPNAAHDEAVDLTCYAGKKYLKGSNKKRSSETLNKVRKYLS